MTLANRGLLALFPSVALCASVGVAAEANADEEAAPDMEFLEYLGMWEGTDEDWLLLDEEAVADNERSDPVPEGEESTETDDES